MELKTFVNIKKNKIKLALVLMTTVDKIKRRSRVVCFRKWINFCLYWIISVFFSSEDTHVQKFTQINRFKNITKWLIWYICHSLPAIFRSETKKHIDVERGGEWKTTTANKDDWTHFNLYIYMNFSTIF